MLRALCGCGYGGRVEGKGMRDIGLRCQGVRRDAVWARRQRGELRGAMVVAEGWGCHRIRWEIGGERERRSRVVSSKRLPWPLSCRQSAPFYQKVRLSVFERVFGPEGIRRVRTGTQRPGGGEGRRKGGHTGSKRGGELRWDREATVLI